VRLGLLTATSPRATSSERCSSRSSSSRARAGKPICVHSREAGGETVRLLTEHGGGLRVILHCFSTPEYVELCNERGYFVSFAGNLTYKSAGDLRKAAVAVRDDLLLVETDAPFLAPMPRRGHANRPAYVALTAQFLARLRGWSDEQGRRGQSANACRAFAIDDPVAARPS